MTELNGLPLGYLVSRRDSRRVDDFIRGLERSGGAGEIEVDGLGPGGGEFEVQFKVSRASLNGEEAYRVLAKGLTWRTSTTRLPAHHDHLTGLVSHSHFLKLLETEVSATHKQGGESVLLLIELEHFRSIRDAVGIAAADVVIRELAEVVHTSIGSVNTLARFADHTFTLFVPNSDVDIAKQLAEQIRGAVEAHVSDVSGRSVSASCSIGVMSITRMTSSAQEALTQADLACRTAIRAGGNDVHFYRRADYSETAVERSKVSGTEIRESMDQGRLSLVFQPIVSLHGQMAKVFQAEARLEDEFGNVVEHDAWMNSAAGQDVALHLDKWIIEQLMDMVQQPNGSGARAHLFVHLSDQAVKEPTVMLHLGRLLKRTGVDASRFIFEISVSATTGQVLFAKVFVKPLKQLGCGVALSRFGAGVKSFRILKHLDVDYLKIDETITADILENTEHLEELQRIQKTARAMNKMTVVTWAPDANSLALLWENGVGYVQGDYAHDPVIEIEQLDVLEPGHLHGLTGKVH
jgi:diguanylate cyclase (GGDEF)-like protein